MVFSLIFNIFFFLPLCYFHSKNQYFILFNNVFITIGFLIILYVTVYLAFIIGFVLVLKTTPPALLGGHFFLQRTLISLFVFIGYIPYLINLFYFFVNSYGLSEADYHKCALFSIRLSVCLFFFICLGFFFYFILNYITLDINLISKKRSFNFFADYKLNYMWLLLCISVTALVSLILFFLAIIYNKRYRIIMFRKDKMLIFYKRL